MKEFTILMPCLNEAASLAYCIREAKSGIERLKLDAEILIADNGSTDGSQDIARANGVRVVEIPKPGYGNALLGGIQAAKGTYIIMGDADGSYDFSGLEDFVREFRSGVDLCMGDRFSGDIEKGAMPRLHYLGVPLLSALGRWRFHTEVNDFHCGMRGFRKDKALELNLQGGGMEFATEMIAAFSLSDAAITQIPVRLRKDRRGGKRSHIRTFRDGLRHLKVIFFYQYTNKTQEGV